MKSTSPAPLALVPALLLGLTAMAQGVAAEPGATPATLSAEEPQQVEDRQVPVWAKPQPGLIEYVMSRLPRVLAGLESGATVALLLTRPGRGTAARRAWGRAWRSRTPRYWAIALRRRAELAGVLPGDVFPLEPGL